jgi:hypothetical protein
MCYARRLRIGRRLFRAEYVVLVLNSLMLIQVPLRLEFFFFFWEFPLIFLTSGASYDRCAYMWRFLNSVSVEDYFLGFVDVLESPSFTN